LANAAVLHAMCVIVAQSSSAVSRIAKMGNPSNANMIQKNKACEES